MMDCLFQAMEEVCIPMTSRFPCCTSVCRPSRGLYPFFFAKSRWSSTKSRHLPPPHMCPDQLAAATCI